ncbi:lectin family integral membrane protein [Pseudovirgaria hyperparasitica]|uniref:Lectin family integral membrane protein n=1 Tax=Pseudovirgaria hyperparasitica TaxID=470096 RepID=A0A6A6VU46_9PEZI|nr:lectin family integral membrane protein [Pseudovirgaria hyperparasitica]KAF2753675.1 lectin family integral membrane protein [Pseudovirgaria hyperparasitica]
MRVAGLSAFVSAVQAQYTLDNLSFGHKDGRISTNDESVDGWQLLGEQYTPYLLSDRVILTPPYPGNKRGAIWSINTMPNTEWVGELNFRASGDDRAGGNMQLWYVKDGKSSVGTNSLYTVDKFDGLMLEIDTYGGRGGVIRGFLNDGTKSFRGHHSVDALSFGQCDYPYRNTGKFLPLTVKQTANGLEVMVDGIPCFRSEQVILPTGYQFGVTAASAENPDSFEVASFRVSTTGSTTREEPRRDQQQNQQAFKQPPSSRGNNIIPDSLAEDIKTQEAQFKDLHDRLQAMTYQIGILHDQITKLHEQQAAIQVETNNQLRPINERVNEAKQVQSRIEDRVNEIKKDIESKDYKDMINALQQAVTAGHSNMMQNLPLQMDQLMSKNGPKLSTFVLIIIAVQIILIGGYILYKRRLKSMPKKYL